MPKKVYPTWDLKSRINYILSGNIRSTVTTLLEGHWATCTYYNSKKLLMDCIIIRRVVSFPLCLDMWGGHVLYLVFIIIIIIAPRQYGLD